MASWRILCGVIALGWCLPLHAENPPHESWTFTFRLENDLFADTDRFYTNGIKLSWISPELQWFQELDWFSDGSLAGTWFNHAVEVLPFSGDETRQRHLALSVGQKMFTPGDIKRTTLDVTDRPYAGWLYGSLAFHSKTRRRLDTFEIQAGLIGPLSLAEEAQDLIHSIRGIDRANGWEHQLDNEPGLALIYDQKRRLFQHQLAGSLWGIDAIGYAGSAVGNVFTHLNAGIEMRLGWNLPADFGSALIRPAGDTNAPTDTNDPRYKPYGRHGTSLHVFAATTGRLVFRDLFLDGNTFSDSHHIDKETLVGDIVAGVSLVLNRVKVSYAQVMRTEEYRGQGSGHNFGSVSISYTY